MANIDFPRGFEPKRHINGGQTLAYTSGLLAAANAQIGKWDLLERRADGFIHRAQAATVTLIGVAAENIAANAGGSISYIPIDGLIMWAQASGAEIDAQTDFDLTYDIIASAPNALTGNSTMEIDSATSGASATLPIKILRVVDVITQSGNSLGANVLLECVANAGVTKGAGLAG